MAFTSAGVGMSTPTRSLPLARFSARLGLMSGQDAQRIVAHMEAVGLPASLRSLGLECSGRRLAGPAVQGAFAAHSGIAPLPPARRAAGIGSRFRPTATARPREMIR